VKEGERKEDENKSKAKNEEEEEEEEEEEGGKCPISLEILPHDITQSVQWTCCGNGMHKHCDNVLHSMHMKMDRSCLLCRAKTPTSSHEESFNQLRPWVHG
jgi:hypothetical protein